MGEIFAVVAPVFLCAAIGWAWARSGRPFDRPAVTALNMELAAPCLVFSRLVSLDIDPEATARIGLASVLALASFAVLGALALRVLRLPTHTYLAPLVFPNTGNMGLAICLFAFGDTGLPFAIAFFSICATAQFTLGPLMWSGRFHARDVVASPIVWALGAALLVLWRGFEVPLWLLRTTHLLGDLAVPLMILSLGVSLAELRVVHPGRAVLLSALRLGIGASVGFGLSALLGLHGVERGVLVVQCSMPSAVFNHLFAQRHDRSPGEVASLVVVSTLAAFILLPVLLPFVTGDR